LKIISHRGWWREPAEKNTLTAFERTIAAGYGTETDVRDLAGRLVVSHDPAEAGAMAWDDLVAMFAKAGLPLAVNVKADGLAPLLARAMATCGIPWFAFDMSGPETVRYAAAGLPYYTRHSDIEPEPILYAQAAGVWLDAFRGDWFDRDVVARHVDAGKAVCLVSPELHGREPRALWDRLADLPGDVTLCTDLPDEADRAFGR
jgi:glycerophosphoryl diester phosphodiesterase